MAKPEKYIMMVMIFIFEFLLRVTEYPIFKETYNWRIV